MSWDGAVSLDVICMGNFPTVPFRRIPRRGCDPSPAGGNRRTEVRYALRYGSDL